MDSVMRTYSFEYRMSTTDVYVRIMGLAPPKGERCAEHGIKRNRTEIGKEECHFIERLIFDWEILFPRPAEGVGRPFYKGIDT